MNRVKVLYGPSIRRMPTYLHKLMAMQVEGADYASTTKLAEYMDLEPIIVRKDISLTGVTGLVGVGYKIDELIAGIRRYLGWDSERSACLVGVGSLGSALLGHTEFGEYGLQFSCIFDQDPAKVGTIVHGHEVLPMTQLTETVKERKPVIGLICVSSECAQAVVDELVACGVRYFWSFANVCLRVPRGVTVQREVVAGGYAMLSVKMNRLGKEGQEVRKERPRKARKEQTKAEQAK